MQHHTGQKAREGTPMEDLHYTTKGTVVNRGCIGKPRVTKAISFYMRKKRITNKNEFEPIPEVLHQREFC